MPSRSTQAASVLLFDFAAESVEPFVSLPLLEELSVEALFLLASLPEDLLSVT